jgi:hypothetical protein
MTDDSRDERHGAETMTLVSPRTTPEGDGRDGGLQHPFSRTTLRARLALLKPRVLKVEPAPGRQH